MDLVYNDLETMYPFINKVYPHSALAWIALASLRDDENVSIEVLARLAAFFVSHGKAMAVRHLLGGDAAPSDHAMTSEALASILGDPTASGRSQRIAERATELLRVESGNGAPDARAGTAVTGLLGQSDARGLRRRATQLHQSGHVDLVVFGHTHHAIDGNAEPSPYGDARRTFNTGSWMPHIPIEPDEKLHWRDLRDRPMSHAIKYLVVDPARSLAWLEDL
jgi:hypothetical protein